MAKEYIDLIEAVEAFENKKAVIFDMDGLIFDTERVFMEQLAVAMEERGYKLTRDIYTQTLGLGGSKLKEVMYGYYGNDYPFEECGHIAQERLTMIAGTVGISVKPQICELLKVLKSEGIPCAVASSTKSEYVKIYLENAGLDAYFNVIIGGEMVKRSKPEPDIFLLACEKLNVVSEEAVVLEDSDNGVAAAYAAGIPVVCVPDLREPSEDTVKAAAAVVRR